MTVDENPVAFMCEADVRALARKPEGADLSISPTPRPDLGMNMALYAHPPASPEPVQDRQLVDALDHLYQIDNLDPAEIAKSPSYVKEMVREAIDALSAAEPVQDRQLVEGKCANCQGMFGDLAPGRDPEELCDTCYTNSRQALSAAEPAIRGDEVEIAARAIAKVVAEKGTFGIDRYNRIAKWVRLHWADYRDHAAAALAAIRSGVE